MPFLDRAGPEAGSVDVAAQICDWHACSAQRFAHGQPAEVTLREGAVTGCCPADGFEQQTRLLVEAKRVDRQPRPFTGLADREMFYLWGTHARTVLLDLECARGPSVAAPVKGVTAGVEGVRTMAVWFITGAGRGLGAAIVRQVLARGDQVVAASRRPEAARGLTEGAHLLSVRLDVTSENDAVAAVDEAVDRFGRIDFLVNNAGRSLLGAVEEATASEVEEVFATNLFGVLAVTRAVLPIMRRQSSGAIVNIGSMGGFAQSPGWGVYGATKFALEGLSEALAAEVQPLGIRVTIVEPGSFRTDFLDSASLRFASTTIADYAATVDPVRAASRSRSGSQANDPDLGAAAIVRAVTAETPPFRLPLGRDAVSTIERKVEAVGLELNRWRSISESTQP